MVPVLSTFRGWVECAETLLQSLQNASTCKSNLSSGTLDILEMTTSMLMAEMENRFEDLSDHMIRL